MILCTTPHNDAAHRHDEARLVLDTSLRLHITAEKHRGLGGPTPVPDVEIDIVVLVFDVDGVNGGTIVVVAVDEELGPLLIDTGVVPSAQMELHPANVSSFAAAQLAQSELLLRVGDANADLASAHEHGSLLQHEHELSVPVAGNILVVQVKIGMPGGQG